MFAKQHSRNTKSRTSKSVAILVSLAMLLCISVGGTVAFLVSSDGPLYNLFNPSEVTTKVVEDITTDPTKKQDVKIQNTGDTDAWIRAAVVVTWQDEDGNVYGQAPKEGIDYHLELPVEWDWICSIYTKFYYYSDSVPAGGTTSNLIEACYLDEDANVPDGYYLNVEIVASGIQSNPRDVVVNEWIYNDMGVAYDQQTDKLEKSN